MLKLNCEAYAWACALDFVLLPLRLGAGYCGESGGGGGGTR